MAQLAGSINQSPRVQQLRAVAEMMNPPAPAAQSKQKEEERQHAAQRKPLKEQKRLTQTKSKLEEKKTLQGRFEESPAQPEEASAPPPNRTGLPDGLKSGIESLSGIAMDNVKVHYNSRQPAQLNALAYTQGSDIHVAPGQEQHLPHEAWHVAQQKQGRVQAVTQLNGVAINDDIALEREADSMGERAAQLARTRSLLHADRSSGVPPAVQRMNVVQRQEGDEVETGTNTGLELEKTIEALRELLQSGESTEQASDLEAYIAELEEIAESDDAALKSVAMQSLEEEAKKQAGSSLPELAQGTAPSGLSGEKGVVQGNFIYDFLVQIAGVIAGHPALFVITTAVLAAAFVKIRAERNRLRRLPLAPSAALFKNRPQYWTYLQRFLDTYCEVDGVTARDKNTLTDAMRTSINNAISESNFKWVQLPATLSGLTFDEARLKNSAFIDNQIFTPFERGVQVVASKNIQSANVETADLAGFSDRLKRLPFVKLLYENKVVGKKGVSAKKTSSGARNRADWKTGASIKQKIREVDDGWSYVTRDRRELDNGNFKKKVEQADFFIRRLVEPSVLSTMAPPGVAVHLRNSSGPSLPWGFRAYQSGGEIHVAQNERQETIVHEIGHYLENNLPMEQWAEIQLLLHARQGGQRTAGYIYPAKTWKSTEEQRFEGSYPATGAYTSKYYASGHTEVMSMSVEYLAHPAKFKTLIETDPQQAALILRLLRPAEFDQYLKGDPYVAKYLPQ